MRFRQWLATAPLTVHFVVQAGLFTVVTYALGRLLDDGSGSWWEHALGGVVFGGLMSVFLARRRRREGGAAEQFRIDQAIRAGRLPDGADPDRWGPVLERKGRQFRRLQPIGAVIYTAFAALAALLALTETPRWWAATAFFAGFGIFAVVTGRRNEIRIRRMKRELGSARPTGV